MEPDPYIQFLENWIPGIGEDTKLHDQLHVHFGLGFSVNDEGQIAWIPVGTSPCWIILSCRDFFNHESDNLSRRI